MTTRVEGVGGELRKSRYHKDSIWQPQSLNFSVLIAQRRVLYLRGGAYIGERKLISF